MGDWIYPIGVGVSFFRIVRFMTGWWMREQMTFPGDELAGIDRLFILLVSVVLAFIWPVTLALALIMIPARGIMDSVVHDADNEGQQNED